MLRNLLEAGDVEGCRRYWHKHSPNMPQPETYEKAEIVMHRARTETRSLPNRIRFYSHRWLEERAIASGLPDMLRPSAERMYPKIVEGVGISVNFRNGWMQPAANEIRGAMEDAVNDAYAEGRTDPEFVRQQMNRAKARRMRALFG
jgi:hypothetical protein